MLDQATTTQPFADRFGEAAPRLAGAGIPWLRTLREDGLRRYAAQGLPTPRVESWRYTNLNKLKRTDFAPAVLAPEPASKRMPLDRTAAVDAHVAVLVNGRFRPDLSRLDDLPKGVSVAGLAAALAEDPAAIEPHLGQIAPTEDMPLLALNTAFMADGIVLRVGEGRMLEKPLHVVSIGSASDQPLVFYPRILILAGPGSHATVIESHVGDGTYFANSVTEVSVGRGAVLGHYKLQNEGPAAYHLAACQTRLADDAVYDSFVLSVGGRLSRNELRAHIGGRHVECRLNGAYMLRGEQHADNTTFIDHAMPESSSREVYKGVLDDRSRGVFQGKILVRRDAQKTDGHQLSQALLLSRGAEVDTKPELEIYADDVKCSHGATTGALDEEPLFYLQARGIGRAEARRMLIEAFLDEAVQEIRNGPVRDAFRGVTRSWLATGGENGGQE